MLIVGWLSSFCIVPSPWTSLWLALGAVVPCAALFRSGLAGVEGERAAGALVVVVGGHGRAVRSRVLHGDRLAAGIGQADREDERRRAAVALGGADVIDRDCG